MCGNFLWSFQNLKNKTWRNSVLYIIFVIAKNITCANEKKIQIYFNLTKFAAHIKKPTRSTIDQNETSSLIKYQKSYLLILPQLCYEDWQRMLHFLFMMMLAGLIKHLSSSKQRNCLILTQWTNNQWILLCQVDNVINVVHLV